MKRRQWVTEPEYQWQVTYLIVSLLLFFMALGLAMVSHAVWFTLRALDAWDNAFFFAVFGRVAWMISIETLIAIPLVVAFGIFLTHKVVGPIGRMKAALDEIGAGNFTMKLKLRRGDALLDLAESINRLATSLQKRR
jgi:methyl-accepting chemotaxis protein